MLLVIRERICARRSMVRTLGLYPSEHLIYAKSQFESVRASQVIDFTYFFRAVAQSGRALRLGRRCRVFESRQLEIFMQGYTVGVAGQTVNLLSSDSGSATLSPCTNSNSWLYRLVQFNMKVR